MIEQFSSHFDAIKSDSGIILIDALDYYHSMFKAYGLGFLCYTDIYLTKLNVSAICYIHQNAPILPIDFKNTLSSNSWDDFIFIAESRKNHGLTTQIIPRSQFNSDRYYTLSNFKNTLIK